jgi:glycine oxidase
MSDPLLILGQGLAGTAVGWHLWRRGLPFFVVDDFTPHSSSSVAAGLLTPITGMRLSLSEDHAALLHEALLHYRYVQQHTDQRFVHLRRHVRYLRSEKEVQLAQKRASQPEVQRFIASLDAEPVPFGRIEMKHGGWIDTPRYLRASRQAFESIAAYEGTRIEDADLQVSETQVLWRDRRFAAVIDCRGWQAQASAKWSWLPWQSAKGSILTFQTHSPMPQRILHRGCWLVPTAEGLLRAGSTYSEDLREPHQADIMQLEKLRRDLRSLLPSDAEELQVQTAVRPILHAQRLVLGRHPAADRWLILNGLGSKGTLRSPRAARLLLDHWLDGKPLPPNQDARANW